MLKTDYAGAAAPAVSGNVVETAAIRAVVDEASLCLRVEDRTRGDAHLTTICPAELGRASKGLDIDPGPMRHVYGLGQEFKRLGSADGDWTAHGVREGVGDLGNGFQGFQRAAVGNVQIPCSTRSGTVGSTTPCSSTTSTSSAGTSPRRRGGPGCSGTSCVSTS